MEKKEAMKILKDFYDKSALFSIRTALDTIIPQLKESEDEEIRKGLIQYFNDFNLDTFAGLDPKKILAWLEKQDDSNKEYWRGYREGKQEILDKYDELEKHGEQKYAGEYNIIGIGSKNAQGKLGEMIKNLKPADKVEPKFHEGDWIVQENIGVYKVIEICESWYEIIDGEDNHYSISFDNEHMCRLWDITKDAREGDVLQLGKVTAIFKKFIGNENCICYCSVFNGEFDTPSQDDADSYGCHNAIPATKEQRDILMKAMSNAGYIFDFEKKELKEIKQNPAWSEEDERKLAESIALIRRNNTGTFYYEKDELSSFLKSLRDRIQPKQEWSEDDEINYNYALAACKYYGEAKGYADTETHQKANNWLKSLKDRVGHFGKGFNVGFSAAKYNQWEPNDEQMKILSIYADQNNYHGTVLTSLYKDLKKLKG